MNRPLVAITLAFVTGIIFNDMTGLGPVISFSVSLAVLGFAALMLFLERREIEWAFVLLFFTLGWFLTAVNAAVQLKGPVEFVGHYVTLEGSVAKEPQVRTNEVVYEIKAESVTAGSLAVDVQGLVLVRVKGGGPVYGYGNRLQAGGFLYLPGEPGNFGAFNYRAYLEQRGIYTILNVRESGDVTLLGTSGGNAMQTLALRVKQRLAGVSDATLNDRQAAVLGGLLFGNRDKLDNEIENLFASTGVAHVLCVSGLHVGYVLGGMLLLAGALRLPRRVTIILVLTGISFYALMTGLGPAVIRAGIMAAIVLLAADLGRQRDWPTSLALAALALLIYKPYYIYETGFQLSFAATWGILYLAPPLGEFLKERLQMNGWLAMPLQVTIAAQLGTLPLLIVYFNQVAPVAPLANLLLVPLLGIIMLAGFTGCVAGVVLLPVAELINLITAVLIDIFLYLAHLLSLVPGGSFYAASPPWYMVPVWYAVLILTVEVYHGHIRLSVEGLKKYVPLVAGVFLLLIIVWPWSGTGGQMQVHFLDVGQGDSILVRFPGGGTMLVDAGPIAAGQEGGLSAGDYAVVPYLRHLGLNKLDVVVITHPHDDHAGGVPAVLDQIDVGALVLPRAAGLKHELLYPVPTDVPVYKVGAGQALLLDKQVEIMVLSPGKNPPRGTEINENDCSIVLRLEYGDVSFLLTGDIEKQAQKELMQMGSNNLDVDVLKVPHHGSRFFEPDFFTTTSPGYAVIQVGERNRFGHPAEVTLEALRGAGATVLRTDTDGAIQFHTDGDNINLITARSPGTAQR